MLAISIGIKTRKPQLALKPMPKQIAVVISFSKTRILILYKNNFFIRIFLFLQLIQNQLK